MGVDQYLLTWNNHRSNFAEAFSELRLEDQLVDVTLLCDGGSFPAHRLVLAACSPYFHELFAKLPTQHPLIFLRDVKQSELEALIEFVYKGEVSVANSELSGLIKIAESLRIKGLGDVSKRDPTPIYVPSTSDKRLSSTFNLQSGRPKKSQKVSPGNGEELADVPLPSVIPPAISQMKFGFPNLIDPGEESPDSDYACNENNAKGKIKIKNFESTPQSSMDSKLKSCLEKRAHDRKQGLQNNLSENFQNVRSSMPFTPFANLLSQSHFASLLNKDLNNVFKKENSEQKESQQFGQGNRNTEKVDSDEKNDNAENEPINQNSAQFNSENQFKNIFDPDFMQGSSFFSKYTQILSNMQSAGIGIGVTNNLAGMSSTPTAEEFQQRMEATMPTTVQDHISIMPKEVKSLTCHLCGATIKHIANFRRHMKQHLNPRRFPCPWCSAAFGRKDNLKTHTRKHHPAEMEGQELNSGTPEVPSSSNFYKDNKEGLNLIKVGDIAQEVHWRFSDNPFQKIESGLSHKDKKEIEQTDRQDGEQIDRQQMEMIDRQEEEEDEYGLIIDDDESMTENDNKDDSNNQMEEINEGMKSVDFNYEKPLLNNENFLQREWQVNNDLNNLEKNREILNNDNNVSLVQVNDKKSYLQQLLLKKTDITDEAEDLSSTNTAMLNDTGYSSPDYKKLPKSHDDSIERHSSEKYTILKSKSKFRGRRLFETSKPSLDLKEKSELSPEFTETSKSSLDFKSLKQDYYCSSNESDAYAFNQSSVDAIPNRPFRFSAKEGKLVSKRDAESNQLSESCKSNENGESSI